MLARQVEQTLTAAFETSRLLAIPLRVDVWISGFLIQQTRW